MPIDIESDPMVETEAVLADVPPDERKAAMARLVTGESYVADAMLRDLLAAGAIDLRSAVRILLVMRVRGGRACWISAAGIAKALGLADVRALRRAGADESALGRAEAEVRRVERAIATIVAGGFCRREGGKGERARAWKVCDAPEDGDQRITECGIQSHQKQYSESTELGTPESPNGVLPLQLSISEESSDRKVCSNAASADAPAASATTHGANDKARNTDGGSGEGGCLDDSGASSVSAQKGRPQGASGSSSKVPTMSPAVVGGIFREAVLSHFPTADFHASFPNGCRKLAAALVGNGCSPDSVGGLAADYVEQFRSGGRRPPRQWNAEWFAQDVPRLLAERAARPRGPAPAADGMADGGDDPCSPAGFVRLFVRRTRAAYALARVRDEGDPGEVEAAAAALAILARNKCANELTVNAWFSWYLSTVTAEEAAKYGVRVRSLAATWESFARVRPRPENALVPPKPVDEDCIWNILDGKVDVSAPNVETVVLTSAMQYGMFIVGSFLAEKFGAAKATELIDRMVRRIQADDPQWGKWLQKVYACTERLEEAVGGYPSGAFLSDWREALGATWEAAGCEPAKSPAAVSQQIVVFVRAFMKHVVSPTAE